MMVLFFNHLTSYFTIRVLFQRTLCFINWWVFSSFNTIACCFQNGVNDDYPTRSTSPLLYVSCHPEGAFHYNARFVITLISLGPKWALKRGCSVFSWMFTIACCLEVSLGLELGLDFMSSSLVDRHTHLYYSPTWHSNDESWSHASINIYWAILWCGKKSNPQDFFAVFSANAWNFKANFYIHI